MAHWEIIKETNEKVQLNKPLLIEGLPGIGNVGKVAVDFLIEELKAKKLCTFFSHKFPHTVFVGENNLIDMPKLEIYYKKFANSSNSAKTNNKRDLLLLAGDIQPIDEESCYTFCEEIIKIAKEYNCTEIITTGGIGLQTVPEKPRVYCTSNDSKLLKEYATTKLLVEADIYGIVGPIVGISGILLGLGKMRGMKGVALLAETFAHPLYLGIKGGKEVLRVLEDKYHFGINLKKMSREIGEVEKELIQRTKALLTDHHKGATAGAKALGKEAGYIG
ncbi:PAC2 family protein [Candidatus Woesearchaeota archaeon]|nr:PAC2 family protein [Candidatus Woesearchaeota archaeon]